MQETEAVTAFPSTKSSVEKQDSPIGLNDEDTAKTPTNLEERSRLDNIGKDTKSGMTSSLQFCSSILPCNDRLCFHATNLEPDCRCNRSLEMGAITTLSTY